MCNKVIWSYEQLRHVAVYSIIHILRFPMEGTVIFGTILVRANLKLLGGVEFCCPKCQLSKSHMSSVKLFTARAVKIRHGKFRSV